MYNISDNIVEYSRILDLNWYRIIARNIDIIFQKLQVELYTCLTIDSSLLLAP